MRIKKGQRKIIVVKYKTYCPLSLFIQDMYFYHMYLSQHLEGK